MKAQTPTQKIDADRDAYEALTDNELHTGAKAYDVREVNGHVHLTVYGNQFVSTQLDELRDMDGYKLNSVSSTLSSNEYALKVLLVDEVDA